ncbi:MAG: hypothetical protein GX418_12395 [Clostridiales bacterium]|nr:hypothetical protein [Clostridiales bacterium]
MKRPVCEGRFAVSRCADCGRPLRHDEIAITRRLVGRGLQRYYCIACLSRRLGVSQAAVELKITEYREMGCALFCPAKAGE